MLCYGYRDSYETDDGEYVEYWYDTQALRCPPAKRSVAFEQAISSVAPEAFAFTAATSVTFAAYSALPEDLSSWLADEYLPNDIRVVRYSGGFDEESEMFVCWFQEEHPESDVVFECYYPERWPADCGFWAWGWESGVGAAVRPFNGRITRMRGNLEIPAFVELEPFDDVQSVDHMPVVSVASFGGCDEVTELVFPYTLVSLYCDSGYAALRNVTTVEFAGGVPEELSGFLSELPKLSKVVYSANPCFQDEWQTFISENQREFPAVAFVRGSEPAEPQWNIVDGVLQSSEDSEGHRFPCVWPSAGDVTVPYAWAGVPVTAIEDSAFVGCTNMTSVRLPTSIRELPELIFENCPLLEEIGLYRLAREDYESTWLYLLAWREWRDCGGEWWSEEWFCESSYRSTFYPGEEEGMDGELCSADGLLYWSHADLVDFEDGSSAWLTFLHLIACPAGKTHVVLASNVTSVASGAFAGCLAQTVTFSSYYDPEGLMDALAGYGDHPYGRTLIDTIRYPYFPYRDPMGEAAPWHSFIEDYYSFAPGSRVTFEEYFLPGAAENFAWNYSPDYGLYGWVKGTKVNPAGRLAIPDEVDHALVGTVQSGVFDGLDDVTELVLPPHVGEIYSEEGQVLPNVTNVVCEGGVPYGLAELLQKMPQLKTVVYSPNPWCAQAWNDFIDEWRCWVADDPSAYRSLDFVRGAEPDEPQWYICEGVVGDGCSFDDEQGFPAVWPSPQGELKVPALWDGRIVTELSENAFKGCSNVTSILLPVSLRSIPEGVFRDCVSLQSIEFYSLSEDEFVGALPSWCKWEELCWNDKAQCDEWCLVTDPTYADFLPEEELFFTFDGALYSGREYQLGDEWCEARLLAWPGGRAPVNIYEYCSDVSLLALLGSKSCQYVFSGYAPCGLVEALEEKGETLIDLRIGDDPYCRAGWVEAVDTLRERGFTVETTTFGVEERAGWRYSSEGESVTICDVMYEGLPALWPLPEGAVTVPSHLAGLPVRWMSDAFVGFDRVTSIEFPYTLRGIDWWCEEGDPTLDRLERLVFWGPAPEGLSDLLLRATNVTTVVYSANPRFAASWAEFREAHRDSGITFEESGLPVEVQWNLQPEDGGAYPCVWPAPQGELVVPYLDGSCVVRELWTGAFAGFDQMTSLKLPASLEEIWLDDLAEHGLFEDCTALRTVEVYRPTRAEYEAALPSSCKWLDEWSNEEPQWCYEPSYEEAFGYQDDGYWASRFFAEGGALYAFDDGWGYYSLVACSPAMDAFTFRWTSGVAMSAFLGTGLSEIECMGWAPEGLADSILAAGFSGTLTVSSDPLCAESWRDVASTLSERQSAATVRYVTPARARWLTDGEGCLTGSAYEGRGCVWPAPEGRFEIPLFVNEMPVTSVDSDAFLDFTNMTEVVLPYTVRSVTGMTGAFSKVTRIEFAGDVPEGLDDFLRSFSRLDVVVYSANPRYAAGWMEAIAANENPYLTFVKGEIPAEPQWYVEDGCLGDCDAVWEWDEKRGCDVPVFFPCVWPAPEGEVCAPTNWGRASDGEWRRITRLGYGAFFGCDKITRLTLPRVLEIGESAFSGCTALEAFDMPAPHMYDDESPYYVEDGVLLCLEDWGGCGWYPARREDESYVLPQTGIVFDGCRYLRSVTVTYDQFASSFYLDCGALTLGRFALCDDVEEVVIADPVGGPDDYREFSFVDGAVYRDNVLCGFLKCGETFRLPGGFSIDNGAVFIGCKHLRRIEIYEDDLIAQWESLNWLFVQPNFEGFDILPRPAWQEPVESGAVFTNGLYVHDGALRGFVERNSDYEIPASVWEISESAFAGRKDILSLSFSGPPPSGLAEALAQASWISFGFSPTLLRPANPWSDEEWADLVDSLRFDYELDISIDTQTTEGEYQWNYYLEWDGENRPYVVLCGTENGYPCVWPLPDKELVIPEKIDGCPVRRADSGAFSGLDMVQRVEFPRTMRWMYDDTLNASTALTEVVLPCSLEGFRPNDDARVALTFIPGDVSDLSEETLSAYLVNGDFSECAGIEELTLSDGVWGVGGSAFWDCPNLKNVRFAESVFVVGEYAFASCPAMETTYLSGSAPDLHEGAYENTTNWSAYVAAGTTGWSGIEGDPDIPECWWMTGFECPLYCPDQDVCVWIDGVAKYYPYGTTVCLQVSGEVQNSMTNRSCIGWIGTGDVPADGTGGSITAVLRRTSSVKWLFDTRYWVDVCSFVGEAVALTDSEGTALQLNGLWVQSDTDLVATAANVTNGWTSLVCTGWVGTGDVPASGSGSRVDFTVTQATSLSWTYMTNHFIKVVSGPGGRADVGGFESVWATANAVFDVTAAADDGYVFSHWEEVDFDDQNAGAVRLDLGRDAQVTVSRPMCLRAKFIPVISFEETAVSVYEQENLVLRVSGGAAGPTASVKVYLAYASASAADLDLANATVDGRTQKGGLKFPLELTWPQGESGVREISIPVKADKAIELDEKLTFQLAEPIGKALNDRASCAVTIVDPQNTSEATDPYFMAQAEPANGGNVTGSGYCTANKKVTLKATAAKGFSFLGWYDGDVLVTQCTSFVFDRTGKSKSSKTAYVVPQEDVPENDTVYVARFITAAADAAAITASIDGFVLDDETASAATNVWAGVYMQWPVVVKGLTETTVKVSGLPAGLKFTAKDIFKKGSKTEIEVPANTIYGAPTAASKSGKPSAVKMTVTTSGKVKKEFVIDLTVDALPERVVGTFAGGSTNGVGGSVVLTVAASGKISGKWISEGKTWTLTAANFSVYDATNESFRTSLTAKNGKIVKTMPILINTDGVAKAEIFEAWWSNWKLEPWKSLAQTWKGQVVDCMTAEGVPVSLTFAANGTAKAIGDFDGYRASASVTLCPLADGGTRLFLYFAPNQKKEFYGVAAIVDLK